MPIESAAAHVRGMFDEIAPTYDRLNHLLSLSIDRLWRRHTVRAVGRLLPPGNAPILDICCGTGDLALELRAGLGPDCTIVAADFSHAMLTRAQQKDAARRPGWGVRGPQPEQASSGWRGNAAPGPAPIKWLQADGLHLPCPDATFAAITTGFGFRNLSDYRAGLAEFLRLLEPGGVLAILEVSRPQTPVLGALYRLYFERLLPRIGGWLSGHPQAYRYLPESVSRFPAPPVLAQWMREAGFTDVTFHRLAGGIVTLHLGRNPGPRS